MRPKTFLQNVAHEAAVKEVVAAILTIGAAIYAAVRWEPIAKWLQLGVAMPRWLFGLMLLLASGLTFAGVLPTYRRAIRARLSAEERAKNAERPPTKTTDNGSESPSEPTKVAESFTLDADRIHLLIALQEAHPADIDLEQAHKATKHCPTKLHTEKQLEIMRNAGVVKERRPPAFSSELI
jgi:hypothetical protein